MSTRSEVFTSRWGMLLAMLGMAIGTGNIWRFPRIAASNGGGSFLVAWAVFLLLWSIPFLILEFGMGKSTRRGTIGSFVKTIGPKFAWMGGVDRLGRRGDHVLLLGCDGMDDPLLLRDPDGRHSDGGAHPVLGCLQLHAPGGPVPRSCRRPGGLRGCPRRARDRDGGPVPHSVAHHSGAGAGRKGTDAAGGVRGAGLPLHARLQSAGRREDLARSAHAERVGHRRGLGPGALLCGVHAGLARTPRSTHS